MASIHKPKGQRYWYAHFRVSMGKDESGKTIWKQIKRCTKQTDEKAARRAADELEKAAEGVGTGTEKSQKLMRILMDAKEMAVQDRLTEPAARQFMVDLYETATGRALECYSVDGWFKEWLERKRDDIKPSTFKLYRLATESFAEWLGDQAQDRLESVTSEHIRLFHRSIHKDRQRTAKTANQYKKSLFSVFKAAAQSGLILSNPVGAVADLPEDDSITREPFTIDEVRGLVEAAKTEEWRVCILLSAYAGLRLSDAANLRWSSVETSTGWLRFEPQKQRRGRKHKKVLEVKIHKTLAAALESLLETRPASDNPDDFVLPSLAGKSAGGRGGLSEQFFTVMKRAGIPREVNQKEANGGSRLIARRSFHSLRHFCNSSMANSEVSQEQRRKLIGHASNSTNDIYTHFERNTLAEAIDRLPEL